MGGGKKKPATLRPAVPSGSGLPQPQPAQQRVTQQPQQGSAASVPTQQPPKEQGPAEPPQRAQQLKTKKLQQGSAAFVPIQQPPKVQGTAEPPQRAQQPQTEQPRQGSDDSVHIQQSPEVQGAAEPPQRAQQLNAKQPQPGSAASVVVQQLLKGKDLVELLQPTGQPETKEPQQGSAASVAVKQPPKVQGTAEPPRDAQQLQAKQPQQGSAASAAVQQPPNGQSLAEPPQPTQQREIEKPQQSSTAQGASQQTLQPEPADGKPAPSGDRDSTAAEPPASSSATAYPPAWKEPWQQCYYTRQHKIALGLQFAPPVARPRDRRGGRGGALSAHPSGQLQFSNWKVQNAVIAGRLKGHAGQFQAGRDKMMEAHAYEPWNTRILVDLAELCYAMKNYGVADAYASFALGLDSGYSSAYKWRARARKGYGFFAGAQDDWYNAIVYATEKDDTATFDEELRKVKELAASTPKADQQAAKQLSHQFDDDVEAAVSLAKTAHTLNLRKRAQIAAGRYPVNRESSLTQLYDPAGPFGVAMDPVSGDSNASAEGSKGELQTADGGSQAGPAVSEVNKGKTKEPLSLMEAVMAQEKPQPQAPFQGFGGRRAKRGLLTMSPQFEHDLQPESAEQALASGSEISPAESERMPSEAGLRESAPAGVDAEPDQDEARGPSASQEAGGLTASGNMAGSPKTAGNGIKKKNNRKKGGSKEVPVEQVTARGILEGPPTPAGPPAARIPQPPSSLVEPSNDAPAPDAATEPFGPEPKHGPNTARQHKQPKPEAEAVTDGEPELFNRQRISMPVDSEEEQYHDAGSGFESAAQLGGLGSRRTSLGSDLCFEDAPETPSEPTWPSKYPEPKVPVQAAGPEHDTSEDVLSPELQSKLREAHEALDKQDYKAALLLCKKAEGTDYMGPEMLAVKAEANLQLGHFKLCVSTHDLIAGQCDDMRIQDRESHFNHAARTVEELLGSVKGAQHAEKLLLILEKLQLESCLEQKAKMMYLLSWSRLRERGVVTRLESFDVVVTMDPRDAESLFDEINGLLKADEELLDALTAIHEDCILHYRRIMTQAAKEVGNLCSTGGKHQEALERYTLALILDPGNITALSNRAKMHLVLENFEAAIADATAVLEAIADSVVTDAKQARDLHFKAVYRLARAHYEHAHANGQAPPLSALEELKSLDSKHQDVTKLISTYHGLIVKYGNKEEVAKLRGLFPSKTSAAPPSKEALAAMGEDGSGLSRESMLRKLWPFRPASSSNPPSNGARGSVRDSAEQQSEGISLDEASDTQIDADELQWLQQEGSQQAAPSLGHAALPRVKLSHVAVKKQPASTFNLTFPQAVEAAEAKQAAEVSKAVEAAKAKQAAKVSKAESEKKHQEGPQGFVLKFADPKPAAQAAATAAAQEASSGFEAESSSAFGRSAPKKGGKAKPDQAPEYLQLPVYKRSLIDSLVRGHKLLHELPASKAKAGRGKPYVTAEKLGDYAGCLSDGIDKYPEKLKEAVQHRTKKLLQRAHKVTREGRPFEAAMMTKSMAQAIGEAPWYMAAAHHCMKAELIPESLACYEAVLAIDPDHVEALDHVCLIHEALGTFKELANLCTRILEKDRHCQAVREVRALSNHMAGDMAAFEKDVEIMRRVPGWRPKKLALAKIVPAVGRPKGKNRAMARK